MSLRRVSVGMAFLAGCLPAGAAAQATDASIGGTVTDTLGQPLALSVDVVHQPTGRHFAVTTGLTGRFVLVQLPIGGPYLIQARLIGYRPATERIEQLAQGEQRRISFRMVPAHSVLAAIEVVGDDGDYRTERIGGSTRIAQNQIRALPTPNRNYADLAALAPWTGPQLALGGQRWTGTDFRLDGARSRNGLRAGEYNAGPFGPPLEAIATFEVNTNVYDVTQGRQGGGEVAALTRSGTNRWEASLLTTYRSDGIGAATDYQGRARAARPFTSVQWGGSIAGPIVRDKAHLFLAAERQDGSAPLLVGLLNTDAAQNAAAIARDSLARILSILGTRYGTDDPAGQTGKLSRDPTTTSGLGRVDWSLSPAHLLTVRSLISAWDNPLSGGVDQPIALKEARSDFLSFEQQTLAALRSTLSSTAQNELRLGFSSARRELVPVSPGVPRGFVQVRSQLPDGTLGNTTIQFGGNRLAPDQSREWAVQLTDLLFRDLGKVQLSIGTDNSISRLTTTIAESQTGLFVFPSITALANNQPNRFTRTVPLTGTAPTSELSVADLSAFVQAAWRPTSRVVLTGGLRWDGSAQLSTPAANPLVETVLGVRTDRRADDWFTLSPRAQVVWDVRGDGHRIFRIGGGLFSSTLPSYAFHNQLLNTGLALADIDLRGPAVPTPDYPAYRANPARIPGVPAGATVPPYVNLVGDRYQSPLTWKASASYRHQFSEAVSVTATVAGSWSTSLYQYLDRNLKTTPVFRLDAEDNRGVYVPAATISAAGLTDVRNALADPRLGRVLSLESAGRADMQGAALEVTVRPRSGRARLDIGYAYTNARDNSTYGCCLARTAAAFTPIATDPRNLSRAWGPSDLELRHRLVVSGFAPLPLGVAISGRVVASSGRRYSLVVDGDLNGDEVNGNDLAFLFDPNDPATPADLAASMRRILADPHNLAGGYIRSHLGQIAGRNDLTTPGTVRLDLRLARPVTLGGRTRATVTLDLYNALNVIDANWGAERVLPLGISSQNPIVNRVPLLRIVGFDQTTRRFRYTVNEQAGVLARGGDPYQFQIGLRFDH